MAAMALPKGFGLQGLGLQFGRGLEVCAGAGGSVTGGLQFRPPGGDPDPGTMSIAASEGVE